MTHQLEERLATQNLYSDVLGRMTSAPYILVASLPRILKVYISPKPAETYKGEAMVALTPNELQHTPAMYKFTLVTRFGYDRPPMNVFEKHVN